MLGTGSAASDKGLSNGKRMVLWALVYCMNSNTEEAKSERRYTTNGGGDPKTLPKQGWLAPKNTLNAGRRMLKDHMVLNVGVSGGATKHPGNTTGADAVVLMGRGLERENTLDASESSEELRWSEVLLREMTREDKEKPIATAARR